jgi:hypothetical protein
MGMTNAEKQAAWRKRRDEELNNLREEVRQLRNRPEGQAEAPSVTLTKRQKAAITADAMDRMNEETVTGNPPATVDLSAFTQPETKPHIVTPCANADAEQIVVHGQVIWPSDSGRYTFEEAWAAFHFWSDENRYVASLGAPVSARSRHWMPMNKWLEYVSPGFGYAWHRITTAQHQNPDKDTETRGPGIHHKTVGGRK